MYRYFVFFREAYWWGKKMSAQKSSIVSSYAGKRSVHLSLREGPFQIYPLHASNLAGALVTDGAGSGVCLNGLEERIHGSRGLRAGASPFSRVASSAGSGSRGEGSRTLRVV